MTVYVTCVFSTGNLNIAIWTENIITSKTIITTKICYDLMQKIMFTLQRLNFNIGRGVVIKALLELYRRARRRAFEYN